MAAIQSEAERQAEEIRGRADAEATSIYAAAYNKSATARQLYSFLKGLEALEASMDEQTTIVLSTNSELFKLLSNP